MIGPALHLSILPTSLGGFLPTQVSEPPTCYNSPYEQAWSTWSTQQPKVMPQAKGAKLKIGSIKLSAIHRFQTGLRRSAKQMTQFQQDIETNGLLRPLSLVYFKEDGQVFV